LAVVTVATTVMPAGAEPADETANTVETQIKRATQHPAQTSSEISSPAVHAVLPVPLSKLSMTRDRPIFSPSRRPPPPAALPVIARQVAPAKPAEPEQPPLILVGTVAGGDSGIAVFVEQSTENTIRLRVNESHQGWILRSIQGREVTLLKERNASVLALAPPGGNAEPARSQAALEPAKRPSRR
jgi:general secretion pathway protein N